MSSEEEDVLDEEEVRQMLQFHSAIHNYRSFGFMMSTFAGGIVVGKVALSGFARVQVVPAALVVGALGILIAFAVPHFLVSRVSGA
mgnify:CR=1 FL=1